MRWVMGNAGLWRHPRDGTAKASGQLSLPFPIVSEVHFSIQTGSKFWRTRLLHAAHGNEQHYPLLLQCPIPLPVSLGRQLWHSCYKPSQTDNSQQWYRPSNSTLTPKYGDWPWLPGKVGLLHSHCQALHNHRIFKVGKILKIIESNH